MMKEGTGFGFLPCCHSLTQKENANVGVNPDFSVKKFYVGNDALLLACCLTKPKDLSIVSGNELMGIYFIMDFLHANNKILLQFMWWQ